MVEIKSNDEKHLVHKEFERLMMIRGLLFCGINFLKNTEDITQRNCFIVSICRILRPFIESGGTGAEAITRLIGYGILSDFPNIKVIDRNSNFQDQLDVHRLDEQKSEIDATVYFSAHRPDEYGNETWKDIFHKEDLFEAQLSFMINRDKAEALSTSLMPEIEQLQAKLEELGGIDYF